MNIKSKPNIWISDLTHTAQGITAATFPLGVGCVFSYAKKEIGNDFDFKLFKFPSTLNESLLTKSPKMLCFSNFKWNFELSYKFAMLAKQRDPEIIIVFGGPNFPIDTKEKIEFFKKRPAIDFVVELEGELAFVNLIKKLSDYNFEAKKLKKNGEVLINTCYLQDGKFIGGPIERIKNINVIPSPYLTGVLDEFFDHPLVPMIETNRGCPFSCAFCADGQASKNKVHRYDPQRTKEELHYIAKRVKNMSELMIVDLNFGMYKQDMVTGKMIMEIQKTYNYPTTVDATVGKNMPERTIDVAKMVKGWSMGASIQSTDPEVLKSIMRSNISSNAYKKLIDFGNSHESAKTYSDIIVGLPGDSKEKHFESLRFCIDNKVSTLRMHQAIMLIGTEMASEKMRNKHGLKTKFRTVPGAVGYYDLLGKKHAIAEIEEIIVANNTLSEKDYLDCRIVNLLVLSFYNNSLFEEVFALLKSINVSSLDWLIYIKEHPELYSERIKKIMKDFIAETSEDLFDSIDEANKIVLSHEVMDKYVSGELGYNELLLNRERLFSNFEDSCDLVFKSVEGTLKEKKLLSKDIENYLIELKRFVLMRKKDLLKNSEKVRSANFKYDFEEICNADYKIDPKAIPLLKNPLRFDFFHNKEQQEYIANQVKLYSAHAEGMGRMLLQSDIRLFFRSFSKSC